ncbi:hypothetical protein EDF24_3436 [Curtobacterium sp. PhB130]|uniref:hypothetical protein n=1 Tax=Curtobacterium sp. PhB130 TaxID=2485178 RepID=UPI000FBDCBF4|nr:hypothetical protein [Curtobacterium sp. PhB130]ROS72176.1 hypothetical protein EDF24_3436 [Curtobacterium sp. PhB130]
MPVMSCEAFLVWRGGALVAEPTGGLPLLYEGSPPSRWWATVDVSLGTVPSDLPFCAEVDVLSELPDEGEIGRVRRVVGPATPTEVRDGIPSSSDVDRAFALLERVPEDWLLYETRVGALPGLGWDAFVGTLLRVPEQTISAVLGGDWRSIIRIEPWLRSADDPGTRSIEA